jgi:cyclic pyranopterin phosphate synthase
MLTVHMRDKGSDMLNRVGGLERRIVLEEIVRRLASRGENLRQAIEKRDLYFRVSLVGGCNLRCPFCHNEGAPAVGQADLTFTCQAMAAAYEVGFRRIQFTGGEPLLHPKVALFVEKARGLFTDVGITTNGTFLPKHLESLVRSKITRIHVSLQAQELQQWGDADEWGIPQWLGGLLELSRSGLLNVRLNMPVPADQVGEAFRFLRDLARFACDVKVFAILPEGSVSSRDYPLWALQSAVEEENQRRVLSGEGGHILLRDFSVPSGIRCNECPDRSRCKEQSHSLRLGADRLLRPCLATRRWDASLEEGDVYRQIRDAALLSLDYIW